MRNIVNDDSIGSATTQFFFMVALKEISNARMGLSTRPVGLLCGV
jgi:hypothetical protein